MFFHRWIQRLSTGLDRHTIIRIQGRPKDPVTAPHPDLVYGQIIKEKKVGRLNVLKKRVLCGAERLRKQEAQPQDQYRRTSLIERLNLTLRQSLAPLVRKSLGFCKDLELMRKRATFFQVFYNFSRLSSELAGAFSGESTVFSRGDSY